MGISPDEGHEMQGEVVLVFCCLIVISVIVMNIKAQHVFMSFDANVLTMKIQNADIWQPGTLFT